MHTSPAVFAWYNTLHLSNVLTESENHWVTTFRPPPHSEVAKLSFWFLKWKLCCMKKLKKIGSFWHKFWNMVIFWDKKTKLEYFLEAGWFYMLLSRTGPNIVSCKILNWHYISLNLPVLAGVCDVYLIIVSYAVFCMPVYWLNEIIAS